jgi:hypothetical protein
LTSCDEDEETEDILPVAAFFSSSTSSAQIGDQVQFTSLENENVSSWEWTFEGGSPATSSEQNPVVTYAEWGVFSVSLVVSGSGFLSLKI